MTATTHLGITLVEQSQAQKEVTVNQALTRLDAFLNNGAKSRTTNTPPGSPATGDLYIVGASPTGVWTGQAGKLTYYDQVWSFITPNEGMTLWVNDENLIYSHNGTAWIASSVGETVITSPVDGEILGYQSGQWKNQPGQRTVFYNTQSGTTYTLVSGDAGKILYFTNGSAITLTLPNNFGIGYNCKIIQAGAGQVTFSPAGGASRRNRQSHTKTAGQWAVCTLEVVTNSGGSAAEYVLSGDAAA